LEQYKWERQVELEFKKSVMPVRLDALRKLWSHMEILSPTSSTPLSHEIRGEIDAQLRTWYYDNGGGVFLGLEAARGFLDARAALMEAGKSDQEIRDAFSLLRAQIKVDVGVYSPEESKVPIARIQP
jgi:hypothetical protein